MLNIAKQSKPSAINQALLLRHKFTVTQQETVLEILKKDPGIAAVPGQTIFILSKGLLKQVQPIV